MKKIVDLFVEGNPLLLDIIRNISITASDKFIIDTVSIKEIWLRRLSSFNDGDKGFEKTLKRLAAWNGEYAMVIMLEEYDGIQIIFTNPNVTYIIGVIYINKKMEQDF